MSDLDLNRPPRTQREDQEIRVWSSRKFISAWSLTWLFSVLLYFSRLTPEAYATCVSFIWLGYFAGNIGEKWVAMREDK